MFGQFGLSLVSVVPSKVLGPSLVAPALAKH